MLSFKHTNTSKIFSVGERKELFLNLKTVIQKVTSSSWRHFAAVISAQNAMGLTQWHGEDHLSHKEYCCFFLNVVPDLQ